MIRLFVAAPLATGATVEATPAQAHYLSSVMRKGPGGAVRLFNGTDGEWQAELAELARGKAVFRAIDQVRMQAPEPDLRLVFAPVKRDATDLIVQKATELGASAILPVTTERTNTGRINLDRLMVIAIEAAEQCERLTVPSIAPLRPLTDLQIDWPGHMPLFVAFERDQSGFLPPAQGSAGLLIGPEGGLGPRDRALLSQWPFVRPVTLGTNILRADTAAIVGLALLQRPVCG